MNKAIFLDRDGTINVEKNYLYKIEDFEYLPRVINGLKNFQDDGFLLIVITNQSGIARGYFSKYDYEVLNAWMIDNLKEKGVIITDSYYCPHHPEAKFAEYRQDCDCRKPKLGLYYRAIEKYSINLEKSYAIGDRIRDCSICNSTSCNGFLISNNEDEDVIKLVKDHFYPNINYAQDLYEASLVIRSQSKSL